MVDDDDNVRAEKVKAAEHNPYSPVPIKFVWQQTTTLKSLFGVAASTLVLKFGFGTKAKLSELQVPGPIITETLPPLDNELLEHYLKWCSGPGVKLDRVPEHLFPQWAFPMMASALSILPFPMTAILNQGCELEINGTIPLGVSLICTAQLADVVEEETKIRITTKITSGYKGNREAIVAYVFAIIPLPAKKKTAKNVKTKGKGRADGVPDEADLIASHNLLSRSGQDYAYFSGDFNPIHWIPTMAKLSGFKNVILHGFAQMALVHEDILRSQCGGDSSLLSNLDVRFISPVVLPTCINVSVDTTSKSDSYKVYVSNKESGALHMAGSFKLKPPASRI